MKIGILMDPIQHIKIAKDSSFAMLLASQDRGHDNFYLTEKNIWLQDGITWGRMQRVTVYDDSVHWFDLGEIIEQPLVELDVLLMRKDPPFDMNYVNLTYLLEQAEAQGLLVINKPSSLRDANEKLFTAWFPQCCPKTMVTSQISLLKDFVSTHKKAVVKPLDVMGGKSIFLLKENDQNLPVILETITENEQRMVMAQQFIPEINQGDKRVILINGTAIPYVLARIPAAHDFRGNLSMGATFEVRELTEHDQWICDEVGPVLQDKGLIFAGIDVIGDYLTEINVTSPTGIRELDAAQGLDIAGELFEKLEEMISCHT
jgi:glutathione synthase